MINDIQSAAWRNSSHRPGSILAELAQLSSTIIQNGATR